MSIHPGSGHIDNKSVTSDDGQSAGSRGREAAKHAHGRDHRHWQGPHHHTHPFGFLRSRWFLVWLAMAVMSVVMIVAVTATDNQALEPAAFFYASAAAPLAILVAIHDRTGLGRTVPPETLLGMFLFGGGIGLLIGGVLDAELTGGEGSRAIWFVGPIEEAAKLVAVVVLASTGRHLSRASGLALGLASAAGFSVMESVAYAFSSLGSGSGLAGAEMTALGRGLTEPFGHLVWTGFICVVAFTAWERLGHVTITWSVAGAFLLAAGLHSANDGLLVEATDQSWVLAFFPVVAVASLYLFIRAIRTVPVPGPGATVTQ